MLSFNPAKLTSLVLFYLNVYKSKELITHEKLFPECRGFPTLVQLALRNQLSP